MCGFSVFLNYDPYLRHLFSAEKRGGDESRILKIDNLVFAFHRLSINGVDDGSQPFVKDGIVLVCNGEIYNYEHLYEKHDLPSSHTKSDCEVILALYRKYKSIDFINELDGVFAFALYDTHTKQLIYARDKYGVRPLYIGFDKSSSHMIVSSTLGAFPPSMKDISQMKSSFVNLIDTVTCRSMANINWYRNNHPSLSVKDALIFSVKKRLMSERPIGCLLSGGLDSSLITSIVVREHLKNGGKASDIRTFSIGMKGATDLKYAKIAADFLGTTHTSWEYDIGTFIKNIPNVIRDIESYDITTVRASVGNWLVSRNIRETTDIKVVFNGDGADEVCSGYLYSKNAPSLEDLQKDQEHLLDNIQYFDVLRSDRSISSHGLEARTPFLDKDFVNAYTSVDISKRAPKCVPGASSEQEVDITKWYLRKQFEGYLPDEVLWRNKEAFSDGVSSCERPWHTILKDHYKKSYGKTEEEVYKEIFFSMYGDIPVIPFKWMPKWSDTDDPSARTLKCYT